ncbi:trypsin-like serine peptidase [Jannaschia aquimarina]|uniref:Trypsin n=1 Tax=Jannaschia aquimarina TaxID=935700 RepID=A0A0D1EJQ7_9RHOB|nr:trypsin-like serine protease [Jannaschia aquimarina]KIT17804.1 Trypsin [Jannaschia aquimarina]SNS91208.1 Trypsin [Jannaschia aquimarina]
MRNLLDIVAKAALAVLLIAGVGYAEDTRMEILATADQSRGWEAVGRLDFGGDGFCTAALVTSDIVLTAAHCLYDNATGKPVPPEKIQFRAGLRYGRAEAYRGIRRIVVHPDYAIEDVDRLSVIGSDLALLELDRPVRATHVKPFRTHLAIREGDEVQVVSYAKDRAEAPSREESCKVLTRDRDILVLSCSVDFGSSGAPVFVRQGDEVRIVSVISAKAAWDDKPVALAAVMEGEFEALLSEFARTPALAPVGNKTVRPREVRPTSSD